MSPRMKNVRKTVDKILNVCILVLFIAMFGVTTLNVIMRGTVISSHRT